MRYIDQWLSGLGLEHVIPKLTESGITTPKKLALLSLRDMFDIGIEDADDRKKLFYLIQRLNAIFKKEQERSGSGPDDAAEQEQEEQQKQLADGEEGAAPASKANVRATGAPTLKSSASEPSVAVSPLRKRQQTPERPAHSVTATSVSSSTGSLPEDDLRSLRQKHKEEKPSPTKKSIAESAQANKVKEAVPAAAESSSRPSYKPSVSSISTSRAGPTTNASSTSDSGPVGPSGISAITARVLASRQFPSRNSTSGSQRTTAEASQAPEPQRSAAAVPVAPPPAEEEEEEEEDDIPDHPWKPPTAQAVRESLAPPSVAAVAATKPVGLAFGLRSRSLLPDPEDNELESPPPPAPPLSLSGSLDGKFSFNQRHIEESARKSIDGRSIAIAQMSREALSRPSTAPVAPVPTASSANIYHPTPVSTDAPIRDMAIRVVVRKRPISRSEFGRGEKDVLEVDCNGETFVHEPRTKVDLTKVIETHAFKFDDAFDADSTNEQIYKRTVKALISVVFDLGRASCFAYGQTGSGKTFTMMGCDPSSPDASDANAGLYVLAARDIFANLRQPQYRDMQVFVSCFEIYGGKLFDLLNDRSPVKCLEDAKHEVQTPGLTEHHVTNVEELLQLMAQGHSLRSIGTTGANMESSRSHQILQIVVRRPVVAPEVNRNRRAGVVPVKSSVVAPFGKLSFIDLAGSERGADTSNNSKQTRMEGAEINTSLLALKEVIRSLERKHGHTPFRGSKLTQVLKDSFVGDKTRTCMIACVSPSHLNCEHTLNTLRYADRVKEHQLSNGGATEISSAALNQSEVDESSYSRRPHTADIADYDQISSNLSRLSTAPQPQQRPATSVPIQPRAAVPAPPAAPQVPPTKELDRIRREAEERRQNDVSKLDTSSSEPVLRARAVPNSRQSLAPPPPSSQPVEFSGPAPAPSGIPKPSSSRESRIPASPMLRRRASLGGNVGSSAETLLALNGKSESVSTANKIPQRLSRPVAPVTPVDVVRDQEEEEPYEDTTERIVDTSIVEDGDDRDGSSSSMGDAEEQRALLFQRTVELLSAHKLAIGEIVEVMKEEMELVQEMESSDEDRDSERYAEMLEGILALKSDTIRTLQKELQTFKAFRNRA